MSATPIADMVEQMMSADIPPDKILLAIRAVEQTTSHSRYTDPAAARRRAWDRERKRLQRADIPPDTVKRTLSSSLSNNTNQEKEGSKKERKSGKVCPPDFHPTDKHFLEGQGFGYSQAEVIAMCDDMKTWSAANANRAVARKADWNLTFTGWMRRNRPKGGRNEKSGNVIAAADRLIERIAEFDRPAPGHVERGLCLGEGAAPVRAISKG